MSLRGVIEVRSDMAQQQMDCVRSRRVNVQILDEERRSSSGGGDEMAAQNKTR